MGGKSSTSLEASFSEFPTGVHPVFSPFSAVANGGLTIALAVLRMVSGGMGDRYAIFPK